MVRRYLQIKSIGILFLFFIYSCTQDYMEPETVINEGGFVLKMDNRGLSGSISAESLIADMRILAFEKRVSFPFSHEIISSTRTDNTIRAQMRTGNWDLVLVSPQGASLFPPTYSRPMASQNMYKYTPVTDSQGYLNETGAAEIFLRRIDNLPTITPDGNHTLTTAIARNVAMVKFVFDKTPGINLVGEHTIELSDVPSTLSWSGEILPNKDNPELVTTPLKRKLIFSTVADDPTMSVSDAVTYIIPAHRGSDFWDSNILKVNDNPVDTITHNMKLSVNLKLEDGSAFVVSNKVIPVVPRCNGILIVRLRINKTDVQINTQIKTWENENVIGDLIVPHLNISKNEVIIKSLNDDNRIFIWSNQSKVLIDNYLYKSNGDLTAIPVSSIFENLTEENINNFTYNSDTGLGEIKLRIASGYNGYNQNTYHICVNANGLRRLIKINLNIN